MNASQPPAAPPSPHQFIMKLIAGPWVAQSLYAVAKLGIPDLLETGPKSAEELAPATGTQPQPLYRLLRALASVGLFAEDERRRFALTPLASPLLSNAPGSQRALVIMMGEEHHRTWGEILYSLRTGKPAFDHVYGRPIFDYLAANPEQARIFDAAMTGVHGAETQVMLDAYDFAGVRTLVDVGGGNGSVLSSVLQQHPAMKGVLFDRPDVIERARASLRAAGLEGRCDAIGGSFFESVPAGGDAYLMRHIIHDWDDERSIAILANCRRAMGPRGKLLVIESVIPPGNGPFFGKLLDLNMLLLPGGLERTEEEYRRLYSAAGFRLTRIVPTALEVSVIEGEPV